MKPQNLTKEQRDRLHVEAQQLVKANPARSYQDCLLDAARKLYSGTPTGKPIEDKAFHDERGRIADQLISQGKADSYLDAAGQAHKILVHTHRLKAMHSTARTALTQACTDLAWLKQHRQTNLQRR